MCLSSKHLFLFKFSYTVKTINKRISTTKMTRAKILIHPDLVNSIKTRQLNKNHVIKILAKKRLLDNSANSNMKLY